MKRSDLMKEIRGLDKELRAEFSGLLLFKVRFSRLRDAELDELHRVSSWYKDIKISQEYRDLRRLWKENTPEWWENARLFNPYLSEYERLKYLRLIFVRSCKNSMPEIIIYDYPDSSKKSV